MHKISIIIPVYNAEKFLNKCLDSLIEQTYKNIEIICVNDGSQDNSLKILKEYQEKDSRIIIIDKENEGVSEARNVGIRKSSGNYITFVDSDDWIELNTIELLYNTLLKEEVDVVRGNYFTNSSYEKVESIGKLNELENRKILTNDKDFVELVVNKLLNGRLPCYTVLLLIKKEKLLRTNLFNKGIVYMEDTIFYNKLMNEIESIYFLETPTYHYLINPESCTKSTEFYIRNMYNLLEVHKLIVNGINEDKFEEKEERIKLITTQISNKIANYFFLMYLSKDKSDKELKSLIDELIENESLYKLFESVDYKTLPKHLVIPIKLIMKKRYSMLFFYYGFRKVIRKLLKRK